VVLCTIHQPSSEVFFLFDIVIYMKEGRIFYQGPVSNIVSYFSGRGFTCPSQYNPSDFIMDVCQRENSADLETKGLFMVDPRADVHKGLSRERRSTLEASPTESSVNIKASTWRQVQLLTYREGINVLRDIPALAGRFGVTILLNFLFGLIFLDAGKRDDSDFSNFSSHFGAVTMVSIASLFGTAQPVMLAFPFERPMFMREYSTGSYGAPAYFLSKAAVELPLAFIQTVAQFILVYYMVGMQGSWIYMVLAAWGIGLSASSSAVILGCAVADAKQVTELAPLVFVPQLLFAGFFIRTSQIPVLSLQHMASTTYN
jgi:hypothetical protein